ncbi:MAG TPA: glycosyltransferase family 4 protein [Verrucomicrobiae bacterium]
MNGSEPAEHLGDGGPRRVVCVLKIFPKLSETFIVNELAELTRRGIELRILSLLPPREEPRHELVAEAGLEPLVYYEPDRFSSLIEEFRPQLLHAHFATESCDVARELSIRHRVPFTFTSHGYDIYRKPPPDYAARAAAAQAVITVSKANADYIARVFAVPPAKIKVIPCGVDLEKFKPEPLSGNGRPPSIVCVARQAAVKNLGVLLRSCALLRQRGRSFRCVLVGDGPCHAELEALRVELRLCDVLSLVGAREHSAVLRYWQQAAIGVLTSNSEGMPVSLMEAAACGVPVVATAVGGVSELVEDGETGLLAPAGDVAGITDRLERLLSNEELRIQMGVAARKRAEDRFSLTRQVDSLLQIWSEIPGEARP